MSPSFDIDPNTRCASVEEAGALALLAWITGISEECWCAGWLTGIEFDLWRAISEPGVSSFITERQRTVLRLLSEECGGWWTWREGEAAPEFLPLEAWLDVVRKKSP
jgi:hypothetical protein